MKVYGIGLYDNTVNLPINGPTFVSPSVVKNADMKLYTEDEIKDVKLEEGYGFIEFEVDEKAFNENQALYAIEYGIPESELGEACTFDEKLLTAEEKFEKENKSDWIGIQEYTTVSKDKTLEEKVSIIVSQEQKISEQNAEIKELEEQVKSLENKEQEVEKDG